MNLGEDLVMNKAFKFAAVSALALIVASPAVAQSAVTGITGLNERIDDIESDVRTDLARGEDTQRFGPLGVPQGWRGSLALSTSATSGNTDTDELSLGSRLTYGTGKWVHLFGVAAEYGRTGGLVTKEEAFVTYEANRYFTEKFYVFGLGRYQYDASAAPHMKVSSALAPVCASSIRRKPPGAFRPARVHSTPSPTLALTTPKLPGSSRRASITPSPIRLH